MRIHWLKWLLPGILALCLGLAAPASQAETPGPVSLYSIWVRLSLRGYNQQEIESLLRNMDPKAVEEVKSRLRDVVMSNLVLKHIGKQFLASRDTDDLRNVRNSIETEIRFAGMQSDEQLRLMIQARFGIQIARL